MGVPVAGLGLRLPLRVRAVRGRLPRPLAAARRRRDAARRGAGRQRVGPRQGGAAARARERDAAGVAALADRVPRRRRVPGGPARARRAGGPPRRPAAALPARRARPAGALVDGAGGTAQEALLRPASGGDAALAARATRRRPAHAPRDAARRGRGTERGGAGGVRARRAQGGLARDGCGPRPGGTRPVRRRRARRRLGGHDGAGGRASDGSVGGGELFRSAVARYGPGGSRSAPTNGHGVRSASVPSDERGLARSEHGRSALPSRG